MSIEDGEVEIFFMTLIPDFRIKEKNHNCKQMKNERKLKKNGKKEKERKFEKDNFELDS